MSQPTYNNKWTNQQLTLAGIHAHMNELINSGSYFQGSVQLGAFGSISWKRLTLRGSWPGIGLLTILYKMLLPLTKHREFQKLTKQSGKCLGCLHVVLAFETWWAVTWGLLWPCNLLWLFTKVKGRVVVWTWFNLVGSHVNWSGVHKSVRLRWQTSNEFTQYSALYPALFGFAVAHAYKISRLRDQDPSAVQALLREVTTQIVQDMPSEDAVIAQAQDLNIFGLVFFSRGPRYVLVGGGALAKHTPEAYPEALPRSKPPKWRSFLRGCWWLLFGDRGLKYIKMGRDTCFMLPLGALCAIPPSIPQSGCPMQPSRLKTASVLTGLCSFIVAADTVCINQLLVLTGRCSSCLDLIRCAE